MAYQTNWKSWQWPWWTKSYDDDYEIYSHFAGIGPFQFYWQSYK